LRWRVMRWVKKASGFASGMENIGLFCRLYKKGLNPPNRLVPAIKSV
jgi:hypothetical protein